MFQEYFDWSFWYGFFGSGRILFAPPQVEVEGYLWSCPTSSFPRHIDIEEVASTARSRTPDSSDSLRTEQFKRRIESDCREQFEKVKKAITAKEEAKRPSKPSPNGTTTRTNKAIKKLRASPPAQSFAEFEAMPKSLQRQVHGKLMEGENELKNLKETLRQIKDESSAISILKQFNESLVNRSFVDQVMNSKEVAKSGSIAPRVDGFEDLGDRSQQEVSTVLSAIATR